MLGNSSSRTEEKDSCPRPWSAPETSCFNLFSELRMFLKVLMWEASASSPCTCDESWLLGWF